MPLLCRKTYCKLPPAEKRIVSCHLLHFVTSTFALDALKVTAAFAPYRIAEDNKSDENVAFVLPIAYDQLAACFTDFVSANRIGKLRLCDAEVFETPLYQDGH